MSLYSRLSPFLIGSLTVAATIQFHIVAEAKTKAEIRTIAKAITVRIDGPGKPGNNGSGIIIERRGDTYMVLTCWHVVDEPGNYTIQPTIDNQRYPVKYSQIRRLDNNIDLAIMVFSSKKNYQVAKIGDSDAIQEGMVVYAAGWYNPGPVVQERIFDNPRGRYVSRISKPLRGYELAYTLELAQPGMSGGPLLNDHGAVIGINGLSSVDVRTGDTNLIAGIPINKFVVLRDKNIARENSRANISLQTPQHLRTANVQQLISLAETKYNQHDYRGAINIFSEVIRLDKNNAFAYRQRGIAYSNLKDYQKAIADFNQAIRLKPKNVVDIYNNRGLAYRDLKEYQKAIADFTQAIRLNPKYAAAYDNRGVIYHTESNTGVW